jgi:hypothetical protein
MANPNLTEPQREALQYYAYRNLNGPGTPVGQLPRIGSVVALIRRGLLHPAAELTAHQLTIEGWEAIDALTSMGAE